MARRTLEVTRPVGERLQLLVCGAYPRGSKHRTDADQSFGMPLVDARELGDYIRQVRAGRHQQPPPIRAWALGAALGALSRRRWMNPMTILLACGHYGLLADLFVRVAAAVPSRIELGELARTLRTVLLEDSSPKYAGIRDDLAIREAQKWDASFEVPERYDRRVWSLDGPTYALFAESWRQLASSADLASGGSSNAAVAACQLIADAAEYPVVDRDRFVSLIIADAVAA